MTRPLDAATSTALGQTPLPLGFVLYLDILNDPLYAWSGYGDLVFAAGQTGDSYLDGKTFKGTGNIVEISSISEGAGGSDALEISLPGVDPLQPAMRQIMTNRERWQFRRAVAWLLVFDPNTANLAIVGKPIRIKTGRMDKMPYSESKGIGGIIKCRVEGYQVYTAIALSTRYCEQTDINPNDTSQKWVFSLANQTPELGVSSAGGGGGYTGGGGTAVSSPGGLGGGGAGTMGGFIGGGVVMV